MGTEKVERTLSESFLRGSATRDERWFQCPGCFSASLGCEPENGWLECECGEKLTLIDLRGPGKPASTAGGDPMTPTSDTTPPAREHEFDTEIIHLPAYMSAVFNMPRLVPGC